MVDFGQKLKELRRERGYTQADLAAKLSVTKSVVSYYENQERVPSPEVLMKIADIFNVSTDFLLGRTREFKILDVSDLNEDEVKAILMVAELFRKGRGDSR